MILELSGEFPVNLLCDAMGINRSSFYYWKKMLSNPAPRTRALIENIQLFQEYHLKYPSHGYRWLNAKIRLDKVMHINVARLLVSRVKLNITNTRNLVLRLRFFQIFLCQRFRLMVHFNVL